jgi:hypothetical protein
MLFIKQSLHDPDSAQFGHSNEASVLVKGNRAMVVRTVRAKNGFGATRTSEFMCLMEARGDQIMPVLVTEKGKNQERVAALLKEWEMISF